MKVKSSPKPGTHKPLENTQNCYRRGTCRPRGFHRPLRMVALHSWSPVNQKLLGWYVCERLGCVGGLFAHLWGLPVKDVVNIHDLPELHVLKGR